jgi:hypothetical protein
MLNRSVARAGKVNFFLPEVIKFESTTPPFATTRVQYTCRTIPEKILCR